MPRTSRSLSTRRVVILDELHPPVELMTVPARPEPASSSPACPPRARSLGIQRSVMVNSGRSQESLTYAIGGATGVEGLPGRALQARVRTAATGY